MAENSISRLSREALFRLDTKVTLTQAEYLLVWPRIDNVWVYEKQYKTSRGLVKVYGCRFGARFFTSGTALSKKKRLEKDLDSKPCNAWLAITILPGSLYELKRRRGEHHHSLQSMDEWKPSTANGGNFKTKRTTSNQMIANAETLSGATSQLIAKIIDLSTLQPPSKIDEKAKSQVLQKNPNSILYPTAKISPSKLDHSMDFQKMSEIGKSGYLDLFKPQVMVPSKREFQDFHETEQPSTSQLSVHKYIPHDLDVDTVLAKAEGRSKVELKCSSNRRCFSDLKFQPTFHHDFDHHQLPHVLRTVKAALELIEGSESVEPLNKVASLLSERLASAGLANEPLTSKIPGWLRKSICEHSSAWLQFLEAPLTTQTSKMDRMFKFRQSSMSSLISTSKSILYIRSYTLSAQQLRSVLEDAGCPPTKFENICRSLGDTKPQGAVTIRYIGQTRGLRAWDRHIKDLRDAGPNPRFITRFLHSIRAICPEILEDILVQEIIDIEELSSEQVPDIDFLERFLIAVCGSGTVNIAAGGISPSWNSPYIDAQIFRSLKTNTYKLFQTAVLSPPDSHQVFLMESYVELVKEYTEKQRISTGIANGPFKEEMKDLLIEQGLARKLLNGYSPGCFIGHSFPSKALREKAQPFFLGELQSRQTGIALTSLNQFAALEQEKLSVSQGEAVRHLAKNHCLPFANAFPWFKASSSDIPAATALLKFYLRIANPLVVCTYGEEVSRMGLSNFGGTKSSPASPMLPFLGSLFLRNYSEGEPDGCVIVIPSMHPGAVQYGNTNEASRVFTMTSAIIWLAMEEAIHSADSEQIKRRLCESIISKVSAKPGPGTESERLIRMLRMVTLVRWQRFHVFHADLAITKHEGYLSIG